MRKITFSLLLLLPFFPLKAEESIDLVKQLIEATEKSLDDQKRLLTQLEEFYRARALFVEDSQNSRAGAALVRAAMRINKQLEEEHLSHLFTSEFLEEIRFFNQVGDRARKAKS